MTSSGVNMITLTFVVSAYVFAIVVYFTSWYKHKREGIDVSTAFKEIPPE